MKRRLIVIRHSKAVAGAFDHERPLSDRGFADAAALGRWLAAEGVVPDRVVVSSARRASQTWEGAEAELETRLEVLTDPRVYDNTVDALLAIIQETPDEVATLVLVGHNPSMAELAIGLDDGAGDATARAAVAQSFPTSGVAAFEVEGKWPKLELRGATLSSFVVPRA